MMLARVEQPTFAGFLEFAKRQAQDKVYPYSDCDDCACAQYAKHIGQFEDWRYVSYADVWDDLNYWAAYQPHTFGSLVTRLELEMKHARYR
jgi:hypothetical protein